MKYDWLCTRALQEGPEGFGYRPEDLGERCDRDQQAHSLIIGVLLHLRNVKTKSIQEQYTRDLV
jgi:hypothetical protein